MDNTTTPPNPEPENMQPTQPLAEPPVTPPVVVEHGSKKKGLKRTLLVLLGLLLLAGVAGAAYMMQQQKIDDLNQQLKTAETTQDEDAEETVAPTANPDLAKSTTLVKNFYSDYNKSVGEGSTNTDALIAKYGNANLAFYKKYYNFGFDPIVCGQDVLPAGYTVSGSKSADGVATISVKDSGNTITVRVVDQGGLTVDGVTCPGSAGTMEPHKLNT